MATFKSLTALDLYRSDVGDEGLKELAALKNLAVLDLGETIVSDKGLKELASFKTLTTLNLIYTFRVTEKGVAELRQALPNCRITR